MTELASALIAEQKDVPGALLPTLHALQNEFGYIDDAAVPLVAEALNLSQAEVHGVVSFYHDFRRVPAGRRVLKICRAEACQSMGGEALASYYKTNPDGSLTVEAVYCLGNCALAPAAMLDGELLGRVTREKLDGLLLQNEPALQTAFQPALQNEPSRGRRVYVSCDSAAVSVGADAVADTIRTQSSVEMVRTGSRGMFWLEPLVEVVTPEGRMAYGPVTPSDVPGILAGGEHPLCLGLTDEIPWLKRQQRLTFAGCGVVDPLSIEGYKTNGGFRGLNRARELSPAAIIEEVTNSGLRGRGGAGFPTGIKWQTARNAPSDRKFVLCNADEGDSGTFADRMILEGDPFALIEGMIIAGLAVGATFGYVYVRSEYPHAFRTLRSAMALARETGYLGAEFDIDVRLGAGSYICGEETAMLESLEGKRGQVRSKPPLPAIEGLFGKPTVVNNVISLASVPVILDKGAAFYRDFGTGRSRGTLTIQLGGNVKRGGLIETAFGMTLREAIYDFGGGTASGRPVRAVQVGGPLGAYFPASMLDTPLDYEAFAARQGMLGHGGIVVFDDTVDLARQARFAMEFCSIESCGKCTPCRIGSVRGVETIDRIIAGERRTENLALLNDLCELMLDGSLCAMGGLTPYPVLSAMRHFPEDFA